MRSLSVCVFFFTCSFFQLNEKAFCAIMCAVIVIYANSVTPFIYFQMCWLECSHASVSATWHCKPRPLLSWLGRRGTPQTGPQTSWKSFWWACKWKTTKASVKSERSASWKERLQSTTAKGSSSFSTSGTWRPSGKVSPGTIIKHTPACWGLAAVHVCSCITTIMAVGMNVTVWILFRFNK